MSRGLKPTGFSACAAIKSKYSSQYWEHNTRCTCGAKLLTLTICDRNCRGFSTEY